MQKRKDPRFRMRALAALFPASLLFGTNAFAAVTPEAPVSAPTVDAAGQAIEEVEVLGQRSLLSFRLEMHQAEDHMWDLFNTLSSSDDFRLTCEQRIGVGSHIQYRACDRAYMERARREALEIAMWLQVPPPTEEQLWAQNAAKHRQFSAEMKSAAEQNPELASAIVDVVTKRQRYTEERRQRRQDSFLVRLLTNNAETNAEEASSMRYRTAQLHVQEGKYAEAAAALEAWVAAEPPNGEAYYLLATSYYYQQMFDKALPHAQQAVELGDPPPEGWLLMLASLHIENRQFDAAEQVVAQLVTRFPDAEAYRTQLQQLKTLNAQR
jgi:TolA-binding protein